VILLDTCVISELAKSSPDRGVSTWIASVPDDALRLSVLTLGEIKRGADLLEVGARRSAIEAWLGGLIATFADRILPVDQAVALRWGAISAEGRRSGRARPPVDSWLAATAVCGGLTLATRNIADFAGTGASVVNPWDGPAR
jgi:predicted nucleic acid-binding protein